MKSLKITLQLAAVLLLMPFYALAQNQLVYVHDDHVKPGMAKEYTQASKEFAEACKKHNIQNADFTVMRMDNGTYRTAAALPNMAALDNNPFSTLGEKMGKENLQALYDRMNKCYDRHNTFFVSNLKDMNYMPDVAVMSAMNFRKYHTFYVTPSNSKMMAEKMKVIAALYTKKGVKEYFRVYHSGIGCAEEFYTAIVYAKDEADYQKTSDEVEKILGEEGNKAMEDLAKYAERYEVSTAVVKSDLSYTATKK